MIKTDLIQKLDNAIVVCEYVYKLEFLKLKSIEPSLNFKIVNLDDMISSMNFSYDDNAIVYIINKYHYSYGQTLNILNAIKNPITDDIYIKNKLESLLSLKKELLSQNLLSVKDDLFFRNLKNKKVFFYVPKNKIYADMLIKFYNLTNHHFLDEDIFEKRKTKIYEFTYIDDELMYLYNNICELVLNGVNIDDIGIFCPDSSYIFHLARFSFMYKIETSFKENNNLINYPIAKDYLKLIKDDSSSNVVYKLKRKYKDDDLILLDNIVDLTKAYLQINDIDLRYKTIKSILSKEIKSEPMYKGVLSITNKILPGFKKHIFIVGCNQNSLPKIFKDDDYLSDELKEQLGLPTSNNKNEKEQFLCKHFLSSNEVQYISYSNIILAKETRKSFLIENNPIIKIDSNEIASNFYSKDFLDYYASKVKKIAKKDPNNSKYKQMLKGISKTLDTSTLYDNRYTKINPILHSDDSKRKYSFSKLDLYFRCPFRYYLERVIRVEKTEDNFSIVLGLILHDTLKNINLDNPENIKEIFQKSVSLYEDRLVSSDKVLLRRIETEFERYIKEFHILINNYQDLEIDDYQREYNIDEDIDSNINVNGTIDLFSFSKDGSSYIFDYKTGNLNTEFKYLDDGINTQLIFYTLLFYMRYKKIPDSLMLLKIVPNYAYSRNPQDYQNDLKKQYQISGVINSDSQILEDTSNKVVDEVKKVIDLKERMKILIENIIRSDESILSNDFPITPYKISKTSTNDACVYCNFNDICYKTKNDFRLIKKHE